MWRWSRARANIRSPSVIKYWTRNVDAGDKLSPFQSLVNVNCSQSIASSKADNRPERRGKITLLVSTIFIPGFNKSWLAPCGGTQISPRRIDCSCQLSDSPPTIMSLTVNWLGGISPSIFGVRTKIQQGTGYLPPGVVHTTAATPCRQRSACWLIKRQAGWRTNLVQREHHYIPFDGQEINLIKFRDGFNPRVDMTQEVADPPSGASLCRKGTPVFLYDSEPGWKILDDIFGESDGT